MMEWRKKITAFFRHPVGAAIWNFVLIMLIFSVSRVFFFGINRSYFFDMSFGHFMSLCGGGLRFDLTALLYLNLLFLLMQFVPLRLRANAVYQKVAKYIYWVCNGLGIVVNCVDMIYFRYTNRRTTCTFFSEFRNDNNLFTIFLESVVQYWYVTLFALLLLALMVWLYRTPQYTPKALNRWLYYTIHSLLFLIVAYFIVIGIRGGFGAYTRPITISNASQYADKPIETAIVLNTPFSLMKSIENQLYQDPQYFADKAEMETVFTPVHQGVPSGSFRPLNVVIIIMESFSKEYVGFFNHDLDNGTYMGYTPFLDSLLAESYTFTNSFASGRKSIDAMPSVLSSIPMFIEPYVVTPYATNEVSSIAEVLGHKGYYSAFFHGAPNGSMGFQAYAKASGFQYYMGMDEYDGPEAFDGTWAIWDEEFFQFYAEQMEQMPQPFITAVFSASSHHPFRIPKRYEGKFPTGTLPIHQCIGYSDYALRRFFERAAQSDWYQHTLFVFTADHTNQLSHSEYVTDKGVYEVPIFFYRPDGSLKEISHCPAQQTDIMPSVLGYLHYDSPYFAFGKDLFSDSLSAEYAVNDNNAVYQIFSDSLMLQFDGTKVRAMYNYQTDRLLKHNLVDSLPQQTEMELYLKAVMQQYVERMINNELIIR